MIEVLNFFTSESHFMGLLILIWVVGIVVQDILVDHAKAKRPCKCEDE